MGEFKGPQTSVTYMDRIYDGTTVFCNKADMAAYPVQNIRVASIVLLELAVVRWAPNKTAANGINGPSVKRNFNEKRVWTEWVVDLRIEAMSVLRAATDGDVQKRDELVIV